MKVLLWSTLGTKVITHKKKLKNSKHFFWFSAIFCFISCCAILLRRFIVFLFSFWVQKLSITGIANFVTPCALKTCSKLCSAPIRNKIAYWNFIIDFFHFRLWILLFSAFDSPQMSAIKGEVIKDMLKFDLNFNSPSASLFLVASRKRKLMKMIVARRGLTLSFRSDFYWFLLLLQSTLNV